MLGKRESYRSGIIISTVLNVVAKGLVFLNIVLIANYFGANLEIDIYFYTYNFILLIVTYMSSVSSSVLIPESIRVRIRQGDSESMKFVNFFLYLYLLILFAGTSLLMLFPVSGFRAISKFDNIAISNNVRLIRMLIPLLLMMSLATFLSDVLVSYHYFTMPMIVSVINSLFSIIFLISFHKSAGISSAIWGLQIAYLINLGILILIMKKQLNWKFTLILVRPTRKVVLNIVYAQVGHLASSLGTYAPIYFFSGWQAGVISALNYSQQIFNQPTSLITNQITIISRIKLNELFVKNDLEAVNINFLTSLKFLLFLLIPITFIIFHFSWEIISVFFNHGSLTAESLALCALFLKYLSLTIPLIAINNIVASIFFVSQNLKIALIYQLATNFVMAILIFLGIKLYGAVGFPLAFLLSYIINVIVLFLICKWKFRFIEFQRIFPYLVGLIVICAVILLILKTIFYFLPNFRSVIKIAIGGGIYIILLSLVNHFLKLNEDYTRFLKSLMTRVKKSGN